MPAIAVPLIIAATSASAGIAEAKIGSNAAKSAAQTQADAEGKSLSAAQQNQAQTLAAIKQVYNTNTAAISPYTQVGAGALAKLAAMEGVQGPTTSGIQAPVQSIPGVTGGPGAGAQFPGAMGAGAPPSAGGPSPYTMGGLVRRPMPMPQGPVQPTPAMMQPNGMPGGMPPPQYTMPRYSPAQFGGQ